MTANRIIDDHSELGSIGSLTHSQIDAAIASSSFVLVSSQSNLNSARIFSAGPGIIFNDKGPGSLFEVSASTTAAIRTKVYAVLTTDISASTNVSGTFNTDVALPSYAGQNFVNDVNIFLNGRLMRNGANFAPSFDVYPGTSEITGDLKFTFNTKLGDVIGIEVLTMSNSPLYLSPYTQAEKDAIELENAYKASAPLNFKELVYASGNLSRINVWTNSAMLTKLFQTDLTYDISDILLTSSLVRIIDSATLVKTFIYSASQLVSITRS